MNTVKHVLTVICEEKPYVNKDQNLVVSLFDLKNKLAVDKDKMLPETTFQSSKRWSL